MYELYVVLLRETAANKTAKLPWVVYKCRKIFISYSKTSRIQSENDKFDFISARKDDFIQIGKFNIRLNWEPV